MSDYKKARAVVKAKEMWVLGREYVTEPTKVRVEPTHLYVALGTTVAAVGNGPLLTRQQRDDAIAKFMSAHNSLSKSDAVQCVGECLLDTQILSIETPATTFEQRWTRWRENDFESKWRDSYRRQERLYREKQDLKKQREEQAKQHQEEMAQLRAMEPYGKGRGRGGKGLVLLGYVDDITLVVSSHFHLDLAFAYFSLRLNPRFSVFR